MSRITSFFGFLSLLFHRIGTIVFISSLTILVTLEVIFRYVFNSPFLWGQEVVGFMLIIVLFCSLSYCWDIGKHVTMTIFSARFKGRLKATADIISALTGMLLFGLLGVQCVRDIPYLIKINDITEELGIPLWPFKAFMAICSFLLTIQLLVYLIGACKRIVIKEKE